MRKIYLKEEEIQTEVEQMAPWLNRQSIWWNMCHVTHITYKSEFKQMMIFIYNQILILQD